MSAESSRSRLSRRRLLALASAGAASSLVAGCASRAEAPPPQPYVPPYIPPAPERVETPAEMYAARIDGGFPLPAIPYQKIDPRFYRQMVANPTGQPAGTVVVDTDNHYLFYTLPGGQAMRYGVGLGRAGFEWSGQGQIEWKQEWPRWFPPDEMIDRQPELEKYRASYDAATNTWLGGMEPGLTNPLGARALYVYKDGKDTLYRVHGSPEWATIGRSVSSGCVRMINQDVIDLYSRVPEKTPIVVYAGRRAV